MPGYTFPIYAADAAIKTFRHCFDKDLDPSIFTKPNPDMIRPVFERIVEKIYGCSRDQLRQPVFTALGCLSFPENHDEAFYSDKLFKMLQRIFSNAGVADFWVFDLFRADGHRMRTLISAIINYQLFLEQRRQASEAARRATDLKRQRAAEIQDDVKQMAHAMEAIQAEAAAKQVETDKVLAEKQEIEASLSQLREQVNVCRQEIQQVNQKQQDLQERDNTISFQIGEAEATYHRLKSERIEMSLEELEEQIKEIENQTIISREKIKALEEMTERMRLRHNRLVKCIHTLQETFAQLAPIEQLMAEEAGAQAVASNLRKQMQWLKTNLERLLLQESSLKKEKEIAVDGGAEQDAKDDEEIAVVMADIRKLEAARDRMEARGDRAKALQARQQIKDLEGRIRAVQERRNRELDRIRAVYEEAVESFSTLNNRLRGYAESISKACTADQGGLQGRQLMQVEA